MIGTRREFLALAAATLALTAAGQTAGAATRRCRVPSGCCTPQPAVDSPRLLFTSQGKTGIVAADGSGLRYFDFKISGQATWQPALMFGDGRRVIFLSMEPRRD